MTTCPLCAATTAAPHYSEPSRDYFRCATCSLVFLSPAQRPGLDAERARYEQHRNHADDAGYVAFLERLAHPVIDRTAPGAIGLDYGSGSADVLAGILSRSGRVTQAYDPMFRPRHELLDATYDFVTSSEVLEHVHEPLAFLTRVAALLRPGGLFGAMTTFYNPSLPFATWWYRRDPTHVCFYHAETMRWIAERFGWTLALPAPNVAIFTRR